MGDTPISIASGFAAFEADRDRCLNDVFKRADKAMYEHKRKIKGGTV
jgi:GGDEF domain-containing protein